MVSQTIYAEDNTYTLNSLRKVLQCNRLTAEKYISKGNYKKTVKSYNNTEYDAWIIPEREIERIKSNLRYTQLGVSVTSVTPEIKSVGMVSDVTSENPLITTELLRNVKELNGRITSLENENKELQKEIKNLTSENIVLERDKSTAENKILLIEDKSRTMEGAYAEQKQRAEALEKVVKSRNIQLIVTGAVLLVVIVVIACYFVFTRV
jgi:chromosome segregation ATPase